MAEPYILTIPLNDYQYLKEDSERYHEIKALVKDLKMDWIGGSQWVSDENPKIREILTGVKKVTERR